MIVRDIADCPRSRVIDGSLLAVLLHPDKVPGAQRLRCSVAMRSYRPERQPSSRY